MKLIDKNHPQLSTVKQCTLLDLNRSSFYYKPVARLADITLLNEIREIWEKRPFYGYRRIHATLRRNGWNINRKRVQSLMPAGGIRAIYPGPKTSMANKQHKVYPYLLNELKIERVNQVWATDITYIKLAKGFVYLIAIIDLRSRYIVSWRLSTSLETAFCLEALEEALQSGTPEIFNSDQGCQFTSAAWVAILQSKGIFISMTGKGRCHDNIRCERLWRSIKYEDVYLQAYESVNEARLSLQKYIEFYNHERVHQALGYKTPAEVYFPALAPAYGYVDNSGELPTYPQAQPQQLTYMMNEVR